MIKKISAILLAFLMTFTMFVGCAGFDPNTIEFVVNGSDDEVRIYTQMTDEFNRTYGKEHGITAKVTSKPVGAYYSYIQTTASARTGPDVMLIVEDFFKGYANTGIIGDVTEEMNAIDDIVFDDIYPTMRNRWRYDMSNNTSDENSPIYGLPVDTKPTALFYNETYFRNAGILVISVDEDDLEGFWAGEKTDRRGRTKQQVIDAYQKMADDGIVAQSAVDEFKNMTRLPKKGYYRSINPYVEGVISWQAPVAVGNKVEEVLIFNNRIAMNWDEVEDVAFIFSASSNPAASGTASKYGSEFGYFTEWWFNYGWSVGGDCLTDLSGSGDWNFSLLDPNDNFIVADGKTFTGAYTGKTYAAGETLELNDKLNVPAGELLVPDSNGDYNYNGVKAGVRAEVKAAANDGTLKTLPSTKAAFERYLKLGAKKDADIGGQKGLDIAPSPNLFGQRTAVNYFFSGDLAMLVQYSIYMTEISDYMSSYGFEWDVAPLVRYKKYTEPTDPMCDTVDVIGVQAGHSNSTAMVVRKRSEKKANAAKFVAWMASKAGQSLRTEYGFFPNQAELLKDVVIPKAPATVNKECFGEAIGFQGAGDWWYMSDYEWINVWAVPLNSYVRNGEMAYSDWYAEYVTSTNNKLKEY